MNREFFRQVYLRSLWGALHSKSGLGSEGDFAKQKKSILGDIIGSYEIKTVLDIGCGDFYWMKDLCQSLDGYTGIDIVPEMISSNRREYGGRNVEFLLLDLTEGSDQQKLRDRKWDLIVCLDVFGHLLNDEVTSLVKFLMHEVQGQYLVLTNRRDDLSRNYLSEEKSRHHGIDLEVHPDFSMTRIEQRPALYPDDWFDLYRLPR